MNPPNIAKKIVKKFIPKGSFLYRFLAKMHRRPLTDFYDLGFHGDTYLISFAINILNKVEQFIETGTSTGSTLVFVSRKFPRISLWSCEPDKKAYAFAKLKTKDFSNIYLSNKTSPEFLFDFKKNNPDLVSKDTFFWLDAHANGFEWPLKREIEFITTNFKKSYIFIDDFLVPGRPWFGYDEYDDQVCSMDFIRDSLTKTNVYTVYYPTYQDRTSPFCKLRGWVLIEFGHKESLSIPPSLSDKIEKISNVY